MTERLLELSRPLLERSVSELLLHLELIRPPSERSEIVLVLLHFSHSFSLQNYIHFSSKRELLEDIGSQIERNTICSKLMGIIRSERGERENHN